MRVAIIQARMGSTRLPGKVLMPACGRPLLEHLLERVRRATRLDRVVVATSQLPADEAIVDFCRSHDQEYFCGDEADVLDRYYQAARQFEALTVVRITADCPLIDPKVIDQAVSLYTAYSGQYELITNRYPLTFPDGMDVDVMPFAALEDAWQNAKSKPQREHVIPYFWEAGKRVFNFTDAGNGFRKHRWTLDYAEDYELIRQILESLYPERPAFGMVDILDFLKDKPKLVALNAKFIPPEKGGPTREK